MDQEEFYTKLKKTLEETTVFPTKYVFKFIVPSDMKIIKEVENLFNHLGAVIEKKASKNGKYTGITIQVEMKSPDRIIQKYQEAGRIEGIISL
jgi:putative lipoic acid-binding regulatory protein